MISVISTVTLTEATISLVVEITVLVLLIVAFALKNRKKYRQHGIAMTSAIALHIITILVVMLPSFSTFFTAPGTTVPFLLDPIVIISFVHVALGLAAVVIGIRLVASWHFKTDLQTCFANKKMMKPTIILWVTAILLGIVMYVIFWASFLLSQL